MKSDIEYFYNIKIEKLYNKENYYYFYYEFNTYYFIPTTRPIEDFQDIIKVENELANKGIFCHQFINNKEGKIITVLDEIKYVMLKIQMENEEIDLIDLAKFQNSLILTREKSKLYRNDWALLWSEKIDYFEYQIREIGKEKDLILNSFSYYVGLAENAISYVNNANENYLKDYILTLSHKRIYYPNYSLNFYNPLAFIFDLRVRDVAEYLKQSFIKNSDPLLELKYYLKNNKLSNYEYHMLYARLLYPSYYFDLYEKIMANEIEENVLVDIISKTDEYEIFLKDVYNLICLYTPLTKVDWLLKKEVNTP